MTRAATGGAARAAAGPGRSPAGDGRRRGRITVSGAIAAWLLAAIVLAGGWPPGVAVQVAAGAAATTGPVTGRALPRFASLASARVNARAGPGVEYPIRWTYQRRFLPVLIVAESQNWRKIRDHDGDESWVHHALLSGRRSFLIEGRIVLLRSEPHAEAPPLLRAEPGVMGELEGCDDTWCRVVLADRKGYLPRDRIWGVTADE
ncbi:MAG: SH3 domain-containing protein [Sneathiellaceae bacterium]